MSLLQSIEYTKISNFVKNNPLLFLEHSFIAYCTFSFVRSILKAGVSNSLQRAFIKFVRFIPGGNAVVKAEQQKILEKIEEYTNSSGQESKFSSDLQTQIPIEGQNSEFILKRMTEIRDNDWKKFTTGKVFGGVYTVDREHSQLLNSAYCLFSSFNPLYPNLFPATRFFEIELVQMAARMLGGDSNATGSITLSGSESILMACKTYRDYARSKNPYLLYPEIIAPVTAHPAFDKAAEYFGLKIVKIDVKREFGMRPNPNDVAKAINSNTILIVCSAPGFPHGVIDPVEEIAQIAQAHNLPLHVDCCLGGFHLAWLKKLDLLQRNFDFSIPAVTSISCDIHKFGFVHKGASVILYKNRELRKYQFTVFTEWPGGLYCSPAVNGSRPGGLIAQAWAGVMHMGQNGFIEQTKIIWEAFKTIKEGIAAIPELKLIGPPDACIIAWDSEVIDIYKLADLMESNGWSMDRLHKPKCLHLVVTPGQIKVINEFLEDLRKTVNQLVSNPDNSIVDGMAPVYGLAATIPERTIVSDLLKDYMDIVFSPQTTQNSNLI
eukprot:TRINITY_DN2730_c0_g2_i1.p1 TRINITY_DN2730_c0_g2~~TRINITY_DN2730_c0_g2_i1.p1  ORF type:complete len:548 (-),score=258.45 TRINITY_DN2730_c0_g2_i1:96-1739(-)